MSLADIWYASPLYRPFISGKPPSRLSHLPPAGRLGDPERGTAIRNGQLTIGKESLRLESAPWSARTLSHAAQLQLQNFCWLDDLAAIGGEDARNVARRLVASWIDDHEHWSATAWAPEILGTRVASWLTHAALLAKGDDDALDQRILESLTRQMRHLRRTATKSLNPLGRIMALRGLIYGTACGVAPAAQLTTALHAFENELVHQFFADGGHRSRSPSLQLQALSAAIDIRDMLAIAGQATPPPIEAAITRMASVGRLCRHGDGGLAAFNGSTESSALADALLSKIPASVVSDSAVDSGFERLVAGSTLVILDAGGFPEPGYDSLGHAGTLAFEMSCGRDRLIVNCGASPDPNLSAAQRSTAAHSTLTIDDTNSSDITGPTRRARINEKLRETAEGNAWLTAAHDGYSANFGLTHRRRIYLSSDGTDLRGEDTLTGPHHGQGVARFHLHPDVSASLVQNGAAVLLRLPSGSAWRLEVRGGRLDVSESLYTAGPAGRRRTEQITIAITLGGEGAQIKWALKRLSS